MKIVLTGLAVILLFLAGRYGSREQVASLFQTEPTVSSAPDGTLLVTRVVDGDTIEVEGGKTVRLTGVNTPETVDPRRPVQCFGHEASDFTRQLLEGQRVRLVKDVSETDKYGRLLRYVYLADGTFVNLLLVQKGYAQASAYPPDIAHQQEFESAQRAARDAGVGLWGSCNSTSAAPSPTAAQSGGQCLIKGNISSGGHIYHLPGCPYYDKTAINTASGERWFCTEAEAQAAGWRRASNCLP